MASSWQDGAKSLSERVQRMWKNKFFTDFTIKISGNDTIKEFKVNRVFLAISSPYFERLFYGSLNDGNDLIELTLNDVDPEIFEEFLSYIYTDIMTIKTFEDAKSMFILADRFLMPDLRTISLSIMEENTTLLNVCHAYEFYKFYNIEHLMKQSLEKILSNISTVINSPGFLQIQKETLITILKEDYLNVASEIEMYKAVCRWIKSDIKDSEVEKETKKEYGDIMFHIRFLSMTAEEFSCGPLMDSYINDADKLKILAKISCKSAPLEFPDGYNYEKRTFVSDDCDFDSSEYKLPGDWRKQLYGAVQSGKIHQIIALYQQGADIDIYYGKKQDTLLHVAAKAGQRESIEWLLSHKVPINKTNFWGWTALHTAAKAGHIDVVKYLLECNADTSILNQSNRSVYNVSTAEVQLMLKSEYLHRISPL